MSPTRAILVAAVLLALGGCAYKPLKAPCAPDEGGVPLAYTEAPTRTDLPAVFQAAGRCGPMKPI